MICIEANLKSLVNQKEICRDNLVDKFSIQIELGEKFYRPLGGGPASIVYGSHPNSSTLFSELKTAEQNIDIAPGEQILACSKDIYRIPLNHLGIVQTKGTLARLFVQATCNDGQIEPGFHGHITLEIVNLSPWKISLPVGSQVAQMYLIKCSTPSEHGYKGRYAESSLKGPTLPLFPRGNES
ncbi:dCTP deaminase [Stenotrophomonas sp. 22692]|uniref:dCTP deaminase n=1 Tax=Stenotrophomonas sp. 22692 TaxID=3453956 RepID=UPI003F83E650